MEQFLVNAFFHLENFSKRELFDGSTYAWEVLDSIGDFLKKAELGKIEIAIPEGVYLINPELISIGKGTVIEPGAYIHGPCIIGRECEIRHAAYVRGNVITGDRCIIGHSTEIKRSLLLDDACASHFNYVGDSVLGNQVNLGAGVKLANLRLDHLVVAISFEGRRISTGLSKMGAIIGDRAQLGCNAVTNPGTIIGKGAFCMPNCAVGGVIPAGAIVKTSQKMVVQEYVDRSC